MQIIKNESEYTMVDWWKKCSSKTMQTLKGAPEEQNIGILYSSTLCSLLE